MFITPSYKPCHPVDAHLHVKPVYLHVPIQSRPRPPLGELDPVGVALQCLLYQLGQGHHSVPVKLRLRYVRGEQPPHLFSEYRLGPCYSVVVLYAL